MTTRPESEQITYVLSGTLVFEVDGRSYRVRAGEAIAVGGNVPHAVCALDEPVKAVDAWSPPRADLGAPRGPSPHTAAVSTPCRRTHEFQTECCERFRI